MFRLKWLLILSCLTTVGCGGKSHQKVPTTPTSNPSPGPQNPATTEVMTGGYLQCDRSGYLSNCKLIRQDVGDDVDIDADWQIIANLNCTDTSQNVWPSKLQLHALDASGSVVASHWLKFGTTESFSLTGSRLTVMDADPAHTASQVFGTTSPCGLSFTALPLPSAYQKEQWQKTEDHLVEQLQVPGLSEDSRQSLVAEAKVLRAALAKWQLDTSRLDEALNQNALGDSL